jgi:hypothetical protein
MLDRCPFQKALAGHRAISRQWWAKLNGTEDFAGVAFSSLIHFDNKPPNCCYCCEYRQYVQGTIRAREKGARWQEIFNSPGPGYEEDHGANRDRRAYGHRFVFPNLFDDAYFDSIIDFGSMLQRIFGCWYFGHDTVGLPGLKAKAKQFNTTYQLELKLKFFLRYMSVNCPGVKPGGTPLPIECTIDVDPS